MGWLTLRYNHRKYCCTKIDSKLVLAEASASWFVFGHPDAGWDFEALVGGWACIVSPRNHC
jgi:hypothetical protein